VVVSSTVPITGNNAGRSYACVFIGVHVLMVGVMMAVSFVHDAFAPPAARPCCSSRCRKGSLR